MSIPDAPDTELAREAAERLRAVASPAVFNHSMRCWLMGRAWAARRGVEHDDEGLFLAALFHDLGLCAAHRDRRRPFPTVGSRLLRDFLAAREVAPERLGRLVDAIDHHMQPLPRWSKGPDAALLHIGAWMDITWLRRLAIRGEAGPILRAWPRLGIHWRFPCALLAAQGSIGAAVGLLFPGPWRD